MKFLFFKGFYKGMKKFGANIVSITNFIILVPVYLIGVGISSIIAKITGKKFLNMKKFDKKAKSYWVEKQRKKQDLEDSYNQF
jgi:hypothetical protein